MSTVNWFDVLRDMDTFPSAIAADATLDAEQTRQLEAANRTANEYGKTLGFGISAIGHLLASAAQNGGVEASTATDLGWLLESLGDLSARLADVSEVTRDKLTALKREG
ncbi:hypothetical protein D3C84_478910 [compost metagenome]